MIYCSAAPGRDILHISPDVVIAEVRQTRERRRLASTFGEAAMVGDILLSPHKMEALVMVLHRGVIQMGWRRRSTQKGEPMTPVLSVSGTARTFLPHL